MEISYDPAKNASNIEKHGIALSRFPEMDVLAVVEDDRYAEARLRVYGMIDGVAHCAAIAIRDDCYRVISLRRAHQKEIKRYAQKD